MWWQLTLTLIAIAGGVWAVHRSAAKAQQDLADIVQRELDDDCLGDESSHVRPVYRDEDGHLIGFVREE